MTTGIDIIPCVCLLDESIQIVVTKLRPFQYVTLVCRVHDDGARFFSYGYYRSDGNGRLDTSSMPASCGGRYEGIEPMGFIWSQIQEPGQKQGRRLVKSNVTTPLVTHFYILDGEVPSGECLDSIARGNWLAYGSCQRLHMSEGVERIEVRRGRLTGTLFIPAGQGPFPGVIDLFGAMGGTVEHRSALLASRGIASFAVQYYTPGEGDKFMKDIEYFEEAIDYLLSHRKVRKPYAGVIGVSKGAEMSLLIGSLIPKVRACIEINGFDIPTMVEHSYRGETFPNVILDMGYAYDAAEHEDLKFKHSFHSATDADHEAFSIPVERGTCQFLLIHGADDQSVAPLAAEYIPRRLRKFGKSNYRVLLYPAAGHLIEPPYSPHFYSTYLAIFGGVLVWGGSLVEHARAQEDSWKQIINFIKTNLDVQSMNYANKL